MSFIPTLTPAASAQQTQATDSGSSTQGLSHSQDQVLTLVTLDNVIRDYHDQAEQNLQNAEALQERIEQIDALSEGNYRKSQLRKTVVAIISAVAFAVLGISCAVAAVLAASSAPLVAFGCGLVALAALGMSAYSARKAWQAHNERHPNLTLIDLEGQFSTEMITFESNMSDAAVYADRILESIHSLRPATAERQQELHQRETSLIDRNANSRVTRMFGSPSSALNGTSE